jgi:transposase-like protein
MTTRERISDDVFIEVCKTSLTMAEAARKLGIHFATFRKIAKQINCYLPNQAGKGIKRKSTFKYTLEEALKYGSLISRESLKKMLIQNNLKNYECEECKISKWNNKEISLELHHIDGNSINNVLENLQLLFPNCHSQTDNFGSKNLNKKDINNMKDINFVNINKKNIIKENNTNNCKYCGKETNNTYCSNECRYKYNSKNIPEKEQLIKDFKELNSNIQVGKKYSVSDNAVKKWITKYDIENIIKEIKKNNRNDKLPDKKTLIFYFKEYKYITVISRKCHYGKKTICELIYKYNLEEFVNSLKT